MKWYLDAYRRMAAKEEGRPYLIMFGQPSLWIYGCLIPSLAIIPIISVLNKIFSLPSEANFVLWLVSVAAILFYLASLD